jgi:uncharacterized protein YabE (DUF348 family)
MFSGILGRLKIKTTQLRWLALFFVLGGLVLLGFGSRKNITLEIDDQSQSISTRLLTVGSLLNAQHVRVGPGDLVQPAATTWLREGSLIQVKHANQVRILADGKTILLTTLERIPANLLALAGIALYPGDQILMAGQPVAQDQPLPDDLPGHRLPVLLLQRAVHLELQTGNTVQELSTTAPTLGQALWEADIDLYAGDRLTPSQETRPAEGMQVLLTRSRQVVIQAGADQITLRTSAGSVGEALAEAGLSLQGLDYSQPPAEANLPADGQIRVVRVREEVLIEQIPLPFDTSYQPDPNLEIDQQNVITPGTYGVTSQRVTIRYEDDQEVARQTGDAWVAQLPQDRIMGYGTQIVQHTVDTPDGTITYWRALRVYATAYHPAVTGSDITSTGQKLRKGIIAVNPNYIPYGTRLYVSGYGEGVAADTGNLPARWIDLGYSDDDFEGWHQYVTVYFLWPPPDQIVWVIP